MLQLFIILFFMLENGVDYAHNQPNYALIMHFFFVAASLFLSLGFDDAICP